MNALDVWTGNLVEAYGKLPLDVLEKIRESLDLTVNRTVSSLEPILGKNHVILERVVSMVGRRTDCSPDDFQKKKWFQADE
jgi:hypothetical protein